MILNGFPVLESHLHYGFCDHHVGHFVSSMAFMEDPIRAVRAVGITQVMGVTQFIVLIVNVKQSLFL